MAERRMTDSEAVEKLHRAMSGTSWDGAADFLDFVAEVIEATGREVVGAGDDPLHWRDAAYGYVKEVS